MQVVRHEIRITNQVLYLNPPVEHTRSQLLLQLHQWLGILTSLPRIQSSRYTVCAIVVTCVVLLCAVQWLLCWITNTFFLLKKNVSCL